MSFTRPLALFALLGLLIIAVACQAATPTVTVSSEQAPKLVIYSGRNENLVAPLIDQFRQKTEIDVDVRYGSTAEMAATILEEGDNSPADVFFGQDAGALGALSAAGKLAPLPEDVLNRVESRFHSSQEDWTGVSGRARVIVYNTDMVQESDLPIDIWGFTDPKWKGKLGWAPTNASFQAFVTALRVLEGEDRARAWLQAMLANDIRSYADNTPIVEATARGEIAAGFVNHYYLLKYKAEQGGDVPANNHFLSAGDAGSIINVAGAGILKTSHNAAAAQEFVRFLLSEEAQTYFAEQTYEYPLLNDISISPELKPLSELQPPNLNLGDLQDLAGTLQLLQDVGALD